MRSIRVFLVVALLATITLTIFLSSLHGYRSSIQEAQSVFDAKLADAAQLLAVTHGTDLQQNSTVATAQQFAFQVWEDGVLGKHSGNTPQDPIAPLQQGYHYRNFTDHRWRTYAMQVEDSGRWIITADRVDIRNTLVENIILKSVVPVVVSLPFAGLMVWFIIGYGLSPLNRLVGRLRNKRADDLSSLPIDEQPRELKQVIASINGLLQRLDASFQRERQFTADAAHELRTPISALKVHLHNISLVLPENNPELQELESAAQRMHNVVEQALALHRTSPEEIETRFVALDLHALVKEYLARTYPQFEEKNHKIELEGKQTCVMGDSFSLETLVQNLLDNACKYTPAGGSIHVLVRSDNERVLLQVHDSGPGIPPDQYQRVFDRFYRLDGDQHASGVAGCGLGLSIVEHVADLHQATVTLDRSKLTGGLSVSVSFPGDQHARGFTLENGKRR